MGVKRFDFIQECDSNDGWLEEAALGQYVLASDYAALEARCRDLQTSLEKYQACRVHDVDEKAWLSKRMTELEAALQKWSDKCTGLHGSQIKCVNETLQNLKIASASETK